MSTLLVRLNQIKAQCDLAWLTPSQQQVWARLHEQLAFGETVNLYGAVGCGKTFLAWLFVKQANATYIASRQAIPVKTNEALLVIDNHPDSREAYRESLKTLAYQHQRATVLISRMAIRDDCYRVQLLLTQTELAPVYQRLVLLEPTLPPPRSMSLHHLFNPDLPLIGENQHE